MEKQERKLTLMDAGRRAEALAQFREEEARRELEREMVESARRKEAATGVLRCLLELKQPVAAAEAAKTRLAACETPEERRQVCFFGLKTDYRTPVKNEKTRIRKEGQADVYGGAGGG